MKIISHRGNLEGSKSCIENSPSAIENVLANDFDCEVDVFVTKEDEILLGHDFGQFRVEVNWLRERSSRLWLHCKNKQALDYFVKSESDFNFFWHEKDSYTLTSRGFVWIYPGQDLVSNAIVVLPELTKSDSFLLRNVGVSGICTDWPLRYA
jgi:hypothetical protein